MDDLNTRKPITRYSVATKARMAEETSRVAMASIKADTEEREAKTARLRAARLAQAGISTD